MLDKIPGWSYSLLLIIAYEVLEAISIAIPQIPELATEWWVPLLMAIITAILSWLASKKSMAAAGARSRFSRFLWG